MTATPEKLDKLPSLGHLGAVKLIVIGCFLWCLKALFLVIAPNWLNIATSVVTNPLLVIWGCIVLYVCWLQFKRWDKQSFRPPGMMAKDFEDAIEVLGQELHKWLKEGGALAPSIEETEFGWLAEKYSDMKTKDVSKVFAFRFKKLEDKCPTPSWLSDMFAPSPSPNWLHQLPSDINESLETVTFLLVSGLYTEGYPGYWVSLRKDFDAMNVKYVFSAIGTSHSVEVNGKVILEEIKRIDGKVVVVTHSKGACDFLEALALEPSISEKIYSFISLQGVFGGSPIVSDLAEKVKIVDTLKYIFKSDGEEFYGMSFKARKAWFEKNPEPLWKRFPTICFATTATYCNSSVLTPVVEFFRYRYNELTDGCVGKRDAILPGSIVVHVHDADHYCPAWRSFPATDKYDPTKLILLLLVLSKTYYKKS